MRKYLIPLIMVLLIPLVTSLEECKREVHLGEIPCMIKSSWTYDDCNSTIVKIYNSVPNLLDTRNFTDFGTSGRCNITWNYTDTNTYFWNVSNGDSGTIHVGGEDEMASLTVMLFIGIITAVFFVMGLRGNFTPNNEVTNFIIKRCLILFGLFLLSLDMAMIVTIADVGGLGLDRELFRFLWVILMSIRIFGIYLFVSTVFRGLSLWKVKKQNARMGYV